MINLPSEARALFLGTLGRIAVQPATRAALQIDGSTLRIDGRRLELKGLRTVLVIAIGKAAVPMYCGVRDVLADAGPRLESIVVAPAPPADPDPYLRFFAGAHPVPDRTSVEAALYTLGRLRRAGPDTLVLFLVSGGSSAMLESALDPAISLRDLAAFHRVLVASGLPITQMNLLRKHISAVKAGRLAAAAAHAAAQCTLVLSDVPDGELGIVGSGPSLPDTGSARARQELYRTFRRSYRLPDSIDRAFEQPGGELLSAGHPAFARSSWRSILSGDSLARNAAALAEAAGFHVTVDNTCDDWPAAEAAAYLLTRLRSLRSPSESTCLISVGEVAVVLGPDPGIGGRNLHFALACASLLRDCPMEAVVLSAGTDGIDGNSPAAGALASNSTWSRAVAAGLDPAGHLSGFNSYPLFHALGDAIVTGPTGNNLRDLRILLTRG